MTRKEGLNVLPRYTTREDSIVGEDGGKHVVLGDDVCHMNKGCNRQPNHSTGSKGVEMGMRYEYEAMKRGAA